MIDSLIPCQPYSIAPAFGGEHSVQNWREGLSVVKVRIHIGQTISREMPAIGWRLVTISFSPGSFDPNGAILPPPFRISRVMIGSILSACSRTLT
jgi:hypothetical protein